VHRDQLFREAVIVIRVAEMQFADRDDMMAGVSELAPPARRTILERAGIVPGVDI